MTKRGYLLHLITLSVIVLAAAIGLANRNEPIFSASTYVLLLGVVTQFAALFGFPKSNRMSQFVNKQTFSFWSALLFPAAIVRLPNWSPVFAILAVPVGFLMAYLLISTLKLMWAALERWRP